MGDFRVRNAKLPGQLGPKRRLERKIFPRNQHSGIGEQAACQGHMVIEQLQPGDLAFGHARIRHDRHQLQGKVMIAHHKFVAGERIECVLEFPGLRNGKVSRIRHAIELALQQSLAGGFGQECERLR